jgi:hypothetical protein
MIDTITSLAEKIVKLLDVNRVRRRELLADIIKPIFDDLENIHRDYLKELTEIQIKCKNNIENLDFQIKELTKKRIFLEPERELIKAKVKQLNTRKWHPRIKEFLLSVDDYFNLGIPLPDLTSLYVDTDYAIECIRHCTGYSRVLHIMQYILNKRAGSKLYFCLWNSERYDGVPSKEIDDVIQETLTLLRKCWEDVCFSYSRIQSESLNTLEWSQIKRSEVKNDY